VAGHNYDPLNELHQKLDDEKRRKAEEEEKARVLALDEQKKQADLKRNPYLPLKEAHAKIEDEPKPVPVNQQQGQPKDAQPKPEPPDPEQDYQARRTALKEDLEKQYRADKITKHEMGYQLARFENGELVKMNSEDRHRKEVASRQHQGQSRDDPNQPKHESSATKEKKEIEGNLPGDREMTKAEQSRANRISDGAGRGGAGHGMGLGSNSGGRGGRGM
jgi:hypothetical protein